MSKEPHLLDILPPNLKQDQSDNNIFKAIGDSERRLYLRTDKSLINDENLEEQTKEVLTHLLWEEHLIKRQEGLVLAETKKEIANLIKSSVELHRYKGTPYAVERALEVIGLRGRIKEWFDYGYEPYTFKVEVQAVSAINQETLSLFERLIHAYKNKRSHLIGLELSMKIQHSVKLGTISTAGETITIYPYQVGSITLHGHQKQATASYSQEILHFSTKGE